MSLSCPACNKPGQTAQVCQRCGCDLSTLHAVDQAARSALLSAVDALRSGDWSGALFHSRRSWRYRHSVEAARIVFLAAVAQGENETASRWHPRTLMESLNGPAAS